MLVSDDQALIARLIEALGNERRCQRAFLEALAEVDERKLHLQLGYQSLFAYCTRGLGLSEASAAKRIAVARLGVRYPWVFDLIERNECTLTSLWILAPIVRSENETNVRSRLTGLTKFQAEQLKAEWLPKPEAKAVIRHLPEPPARVTELLPISSLPLPNEQELLRVVEALPSVAVATPSTSLRVEAVQAKRVGFHFTADEQLLTKFRKAQALLRRQYPKGEPEWIFSEALDLLLREKDPGQRPLHGRLAIGSKSRFVPEGLKRRVWHRDGGRCTFVGSDGTRCEATSYLEVDHIEPWSQGGKTTLDNLRMLCSAHHRLNTEQAFGKWKKNSRH